MTQTARLYAPYHHIPRGTQLSTIRHMQSSKQDQLTPPHPVHYKITSLQYVTIWVVASEVGHSRDNNVTCTVGIKNGRVCFKTQSGIFTRMLGFKPCGSRIKI